jgi:hypothetical protein
MKILAAENRAKYASENRAKYTAENRVTFASENRVTGESAENTDGHVSIPASAHAASRDGASCDGANRDVAGRGVASRGVASRDVANRGVANRGVANRDVANRGVANRGVANRDVANRGVANRGVANRDVAGRSASVARLLAVLALTAVMCAGCSLAPNGGHYPLGGFFDYVMLVITGIFIGAMGTMIGAGGGFMLVPILLLVYRMSPQHAIATSSVVVFLNALSGTFSYANQKRVDYELGLKFSVFAVPGTIVGALIAQRFSLPVFSAVFALVLALLSYSLLFKGEFYLVCAKSGIMPAERYVFDTAGQTHTYAPDLSIGYAGSVLVGLMSGLLGIGGGLIHVPLMNFMAIPIHVAAATSHFIITITGFFAVVVFAGLGKIDLDYAAFLSIGSILGAYYGAKLALISKPDVIKKTIAILLAFIAMRLFMNIT